MYGYERWKKYSVEEKSEFGKSPFLKDFFVPKKIF